MAIVCKGFDGQMTEADWARMAQLMGGVPTVRDADDLTVSADVQGTTVTAAIIPGVSWAHGVMVTSDATETATTQLTPKGTHYDYVVLTRDWQNNSAKFEIITGGTAERARDVIADNPGTKHQQLLAAIKTVNGDIEVLDRRAFAGRVAYADSLAAIPTPHEGDMIVTGEPAAWIYRGRGWGAPFPRIETGYRYAMFNSSSVYSYKVDFEHPYRKPPTVVASMATGAGGTQMINVRTFNVTTTGFSLAFVTVDGSKPAGVKAEANWFAVGV